MEVRLIKMIKKCKYMLVEYWSVFFIAFFLICTIVFLAIRKDNIYVYGADLLDSNILWNKMKRDALIAGTSDAVHVPFLKGDKILDRLLKFSFAPVEVVYALLPPFWAYVFCFYARILLACSGWYIMAKVILPESQRKNNLNIIVFCGFLYGIIPIWPVGSGAFGFAIMPWIVADFFLIYKMGKWRYFLGVIIFPLFAGLALFGIFICGYLAIFIIYDTVKNKKINFKFLLAFILLCISYLFFEREVITQVASGSTIYDNFKKGVFRSLAESIDLFFDAFRRGHYHSGDCHEYIVFPTCLIGIMVINVIHIKNKDAIMKVIFDPLNLLMAWIIFNALIYVLWDDSVFINAVCTFLPLLNGLNLTRTLWFNPFAWYLCFFFLLVRLKEHCFHYLANVMCLCAFSAICLMGADISQSCIYNDISTNLELSLRETIKKEKTDRITWREFYSEDLFEKIKKEINYKGEWAVAFGMHPAILNYNGIYTLDGYYSGYSKQYKEEFSELIRPYLESGSDKVDYFVDYGIRAYIFCDEADYDAGRFLEIKPCEMLMDADVFREMGGEYVFSRVPISNFKKLEFQFLGCFTDEENSPYSIYVYCNK